MIMRLLYQIVVVFLFVAYVFTASIDHDLFEKEAHLHEIGIQIQYMQEKLYANCPNVFQTPNSGSLALIGRRRSIDSSLDLEIELAEKTLEDLISEFGNCTRSTPIMTLRSLTETRTPMTSTETTSHTTSTETARTSHTTSTDPTSTETTSHPMSTETTSFPTSTETTSHPTSVQSTSTNLLHTTIHRCKLLRSYMTYIHVIFSQTLSLNPPQKREYHYPVKFKWTLNILKE